MKKKYCRGLIILAGIPVLLWAVSCVKEGPGSSRKLFTLLDEDHTGIGFANQVTYTEEYNTYTYRNFYNGAGVGLGDVNNDGLTDIYFCGNIVDNKLYLNRGGFRFEDITAGAGVACPGVWSTGVSMADVNGDGWLDIYVCKSGDPDTGHRHNELFINNGDLSFTERAAEYGIADLGLSTHSAFFDYDRDGDLDCYLLNNSFQSVTEFDILPGQREIRDTLGGNKLYRNDGGSFTDVSAEAGIYGSKIGFGLGVSVADVNRDGWMDMYVSNDFFERDYLYLNRGDGTFAEALEQQLNEISMGAMGADIADINNDAYPDIFVTEMTAEGDARLKTKVLFESWEQYRFKLDRGYYHQFARNVLQVNNRNGTFSEIGRYAGVSATDWSWGALILDFDNDGWKDLFVANGIFKDLLDRDYLDLYSNPSIMRSMIESEEKAILTLIDQIPSVRIPNYAFHNNRDLTFTNYSEVWGLDRPSYSNGTAYGDLDNDGDLDLVINNVNMPPFIYRNETQDRQGGHFLVLKLSGNKPNTRAIGAAVTIFFGGQAGYQELVPMRGFKSTMDHRLHFGLGKAGKIDSMHVCWPDGSCSRFFDLEVNRMLELVQGTSEVEPLSRIVTGHEPDQSEGHVFYPQFTRLDGGVPGLNYGHAENPFADFDRDLLLFHNHSNEGPKMAVGDINGDGLDDCFICGAKGSAGALFVQQSSGRFTRTNRELFREDAISEDTDCVFFDADGDDDLDLYVCSGSYEFPSSSSALRDRLYLNDGTGTYIRSQQMLPVARYLSTSCVEPADFDSDGDADLFVGVRLRPFLYGVPVSSYLLENDGNGNFNDVSTDLAPDLKELGMVTAMAWADVDADGDKDMLVAGDWMPLTLLVNDEGRFSNQSERWGLSGSEGWWQAVKAKDLDRDGDVDFVVGNHGLNSRFRASPEKPVTMYLNDFDLNGRPDHIICAFNGDTSYPVVMKDALVRHIPALANRFRTFDEYKQKTVGEIFSGEMLQQSVVLKAHRLESGILLNRGTEGFEWRPLPREVQYAPVYGIAIEDFDGDGMDEVLTGGNQYMAKPQTGIYAASYGTCLDSRDGSWSVIPADSSGFSVRGQIRDFSIIGINGRKVLAVVKNNDILELYKFH